MTGDGTVKTITVGNVWTPQGYGCYGGWALQMVYDFGSYETAQPDASQRRMIYLYDGYERKFSGDPATNITLTGLQPQGTGAKLGTVAFEGDATIAGDTISYSDTTSPMTELLNPVTNRTGNYFVGRADGAVPHYAVGTRTFYNASVNATTASLPNLVAGDSTLTLSVRTTGDSFLLTNEIVSVPVADIKITKTAANGEQDAACAPGSTPSFRLTIYNSGSVPITRISVTDQLAPGCARDVTQIRAIGDVTLDEVSISDPMLDELSCAQEGPLAAGAQRVCTGSHVVTEAEARSGSLVNVATATSAQVDSPATGTVTTPTKADERVTVSKTAQLDDTNGDGLGQPGERIDYSIMVTNAGDVTLDEVGISDPMLAQLDCGRRETGPLAPGESITCTGSHVVTEAEAAAGSVVNVATATGPQIDDTTGTATVPTASTPVEPAPGPSTAPSVEPTPEPPARHPGAWIARTGSSVQPWHLLVGLLLVASGVILITRRKKKEKK